MKPNNLRRLSAVHEAGHAVAAAILHVPFNYASIVKHGSSAGVLAMPERWLNLGLVPILSTRPYYTMTRRYQMVYAGCAAVGWVFGREHASYGTQGDYELCERILDKAMHWSRNISEPLPDRNALAEQLKHDITVKLGIRYPALMEVTEILLERDKITAKDVRQIVRTTPFGFPPQHMPSPE